MFKLSSAFKARLCLLICVVNVTMLKLDIWGFGDCGRLGQYKEKREKFEEEERIEKTE